MVVGRLPMMVDHLENDDRLWWLIWLVKWLAHGNDGAVYKKVIANRLNPVR